MLVKDFFLDLQLKKIPIVVDQPELFSVFKKHAECVFSYNDFDFSAKNTAFLVLSSFDFLNTEMKSYIKKSQSKIMLFPLTKHLAARHVSDDYFNLIDYSFDALINSDITACYESVQEISSSFSKKTLLTHQSENSDLSIEVNAIQKLNCNSMIEYGNVFSPYCLFEYALFQPPEAKQLVVNGQFEFNYVLVSAPFEKAHLDQNKNKLMDKINHSKHATLVINDNVIQSLRVDGSELVHCFNDGICASRNIVEVAFGVNTYMQRCFDRNINSPLNEGILGTHVGIGTGKNEYHIDFISTEINFNDFNKQYVP